MVEGRRSAAPSSSRYLRSLICSSRSATPARGWIRTRFADRAFCKTDENLFPSAIPLWYWTLSSNERSLPVGQVSSTRPRSRRNSFIGMDGDFISRRLLYWFQRLYRKHGSFLRKIAGKITQQR